MPRTPGGVAGGVTKPTPKKRRAPGVIVQSLLKRFEKVKQVKPEVLKKVTALVLSAKGFQKLRLFIDAT